MTKIEEVARAICAASDSSNWCGCTDICGVMQNRARAAIMAMKNPTNKMVEAGQFAPCGSVSGAGRAVDTYKAMIDAALGDK